MVRSWSNPRLKPRRIGIFQLHVPRAGHGPPRMVGRNGRRLGMPVNSCARVAPDVSTDGEAGCDWRRIVVPAEPFAEPLITIVATATNIATRENWRPTRSADRHDTEAIPRLSSSRRSAGHSYGTNYLKRRNQETFPNGHGTYAESRS